MDISSQYKTDDDAGNTTAASQAKQIFHSGTAKMHCTAVTSDMKNILNCCT